MDSKSQPLPSSYTDAGDLPPPAYSESSIHSSTKPSSSSAPSDQKPNPYTIPSTSHYSTQISAQLQSLTTTIASLQTQQSLLTHAQDQHILSLLTHQIQLYLSSFAISGLRKGTLILVPKGGLGTEDEGRKAVPTQYDFRDPSDFDRMVRVSNETEAEAEVAGKKEEQRGEGGYKYDEFKDEYKYVEHSDGYHYDESNDTFSWEREQSRNTSDTEAETWYWKDEAMARRLVSYLRPPPQDPRTLDLPPRKEEIQRPELEKTASAGSSRGFWGRKKSSAKNEDRPPLIEEPKKVEVKKEEDRVDMEVEAEEVVFRAENDFGVYETKRGWGIILRLKVILAAR